MLPSFSNAFRLVFLFLGRKVNVHTSNFSDFLFWWNLSCTIHSCCFQWQSTEKVLVLEYMDGIRLNDTEALEAFGVNKQKIVEEITRAYSHQIYVDGFFNGDPHPGTLLLSPSLHVFVLTCNVNMCNIY